MKKVLLLGVIVLAQSCGWEIVDTGHVGVKTQFGKIIESGIPEGLQFYMPFTGKSISEVDLRIQKGEGEESTFTKDNQEVKVKFVINYRLDSKQTETIYRNGNGSYFENVAPQIIIGTMKEVVGQFNAETIVSQRAKVNDDVLKAIKDKLATKAIVLENFEVTNFAFDPQYQAAIEAKMIATQKAKEAENTTAQIREEKEQTILAAQGAAEAMRIKSQALSANKNLVEYEAVQKWDGKLPVTMMGQSVPFVNLK